MERSLVIIDETLEVVGVDAVFPCDADGRPR
jgi:hypothetical protein